MYEFGTTEISGANNSASRASWSTVLTSPTLLDATPISTFNFTKGTDNWDPIPSLILTKVGNPKQESSVQIKGYRGSIFVSNVKSATTINVYGLDGTLIQNKVIKTDADFEIGKGLWIVKAIAADGNKAAKILAQ
ncbi:MAG: hypothetical protein Q7U47_06120 [Paludibacter sp.]|nr:hypothetical protein [Paludibacter sp.]